MPLPKLRRGRTCNQTTRGTRKGAREVDPKNLTEREDETNQISSSIQNTRQTPLKNHIIPILKKLEDRKKVETKVINQSNFS
jgi:hypothetical protein